MTGFPRGWQRTMWPEWTGQSQQGPVTGVQGGHGAGEQLRPMMPLLLASSQGATSFPKPSPPPVLCSCVVSVALCVLCPRRSAGKEGGHGQTWTGNDRLQWNGHQTPRLPPTNLQRVFHGPPHLP